MYVLFCCLTITFSDNYASPFLCCSGLNFARSASMDHPQPEQQHEDFVNNVTAAVLRQLSHTNNGQGDTDLVSLITRRVLRQSVTDLPPPRTPQEQLNRQFSNASASSSSVTSASLSRNSSCTSASTASTEFYDDVSGATTPPAQVRRRSTRTLDFSQIDEPVQKRRRRRNKNPYSRWVRGPILKVMDKEFLSKPESILFKHQLKKQRNPDGTRSYKKYKEINFPVFKRMVRPILRRLMAKLVVSGEVGESNDHGQVYRKLYMAALQIVKKRRANHTQSWRVEKKPLPLVYSNTSPPSRSRIEESQFQPSQQRIEESQFQPSQQDPQDEIPEDGEIPDDEILGVRNEDEHNEDNEDGEIPGDVQEDPQQDDENLGTNPLFHYCAMCRVKLDFNKMYPTYEDGWHPSLTHQKHWCRPCYKKHMTTEIIPFIFNGDERKRQLAIFNKKFNDNSTTTSTPTSKRKSTQGNVWVGVSVGGCECMCVFGVHSTFRTT